MPLLDVAFIIGLAGWAFFIGLRLAGYARRRRYRQATKGRLATESFQPGRKRRFPYFRRRLLMTDTEFVFYRALLDAVGEELTIMSKVRAAAVVGCSRADWAAGYGAPIAQKELDFVLLRPGTSYVLAAVELDDRSHERRERRERDQFLDAAFETAGVPLLRFRVQRRYVAADIREALAGVIPEPVGGG